jgi:predicted glutamine amidotransferase
LMVSLYTNVFGLIFPFRGHRVRYPWVFFHEGEIITIKLKNNEYEYRSSIYYYKLICLIECFPKDIFLDE